MEQTPVLEMSGISKSFPGVKALDNVSPVSYTHLLRAPAAPSLPAALSPPATPSPPTIPFPATRPFPVFRVGCFAGSPPSRSWPSPARRLPPDFSAGCLSPPIALSPVGRQSRALLSR